MNAESTTDVASVSALCATTMPSGGNHLCGTRSKALSALVRFVLSVRSLGPARVATKLVRRVSSRITRPAATLLRPDSNLDLLRRCSWLEKTPQIRIIDSAVTQDDLARFQIQMNYPRFYYRAERRIRYSLWHCVGTALSGLDRASIVIDVGAQAGLWGSMIRRRFGCRVFDVDLEYKPGRHGFRIGAPASSIPIESGSVSHVVSFCAFNCFEGDDDTAMILEAARVLVPGGKLVIVPLCIGDEYVNLYDPRLIASVERLDRGARPAVLADWGNKFGRWYDRHAFEQRILRHAGAFDTEIHRVSHPFNSHEGFDAMYAVRLIRRP